MSTLNATQLAVHVLDGHRIASFLGRALVVVIAYLASRFAALAIAVAFGAPGPPELLTWFALELAAGTVVAITLIPIAQLLAGSTNRRVVALATVILVSFLAVLIEGAAFQPAAVPLATLPLGALLQVGVAVVTARAIVRLVAQTGAASELPMIAHRSEWAWAWRYTLSALTYVFLYFVTGAINYSLVTGQFYESHVAGLVLPSPAVVLAVAVLEGVLFPLAVLPLLYALPGSSRRRALIAGGALFVLGGLVPLLTASSLPLVLRATSAVEILFQKLPAGAAAALLLGPGRNPRVR